MLQMGKHVPHLAESRLSFRKHRIEKCTFQSGERGQGLLCSNVYSQPEGFSLSS